MDRAALVVAVCAKNKKIVEILLANGADVRVANSQGSTPFHVAATLKKCEIAELLVANGASIDQQVGEPKK